MMGARRDPPSVSFKTQSSRWPPPPFLRKRAARKQVAEFTKRGVEEAHGNFNIWYGRYESTEGARGYDRGSKGTNAETRCVAATDVGRTKADKSPSPSLCYLFAQGRCHHGPACNFLHRLPDDLFGASLDHSRDCFGRMRHASDADGMGGVGNFMRNSKTLFVGGLRVAKGDNLEKRVREHFGEWGELEVCKVFPGRYAAGSYASLPQVQCCTCKV